MLTEVLVGGKRVSTNEHFFKPYKELAVPRPQIKTDIVPVRGGFKVTLSTDRFARAVYLSAPNSVGFFADNYFDLIPGQKVEVEVSDRSSHRSQRLSKVASRFDHWQMLFEVVIKTQPAKRVSA